VNAERWSRIALQSSDVQKSLGLLHQDVLDIRPILLSTAELAASSWNKRWAIFSSRSPVSQLT
jgi:hypothetical protein